MRVHALSSLAASPHMHQRHPGLCSAGEASQHIGGQEAQQQVHFLATEAIGMRFGYGCGSNARTPSEHPNLQSTKMGGAPTPKWYHWC